MILASSTLQLAGTCIGVARVGPFSVVDDRGRTLSAVLDDFNPGNVERIHAVFVGGSQAPARVRALVDFPSLAE